MTAPEDQQVSNINSSNTMVQQVSSINSSNTMVQQVSSINSSNTMVQTSSDHMTRPLVDQNTEATQTMMNHQGNVTYTSVHVSTPIQI